MCNRENGSMNGVIAYSAIAAEFRRNRANKFLISIEDGIITESISDVIK